MGEAQAELVRMLRLLQSMSTEISILLYSLIVSLYVPVCP